MGNKKYQCRFNVAGKILEVGETETFPSGFQKRTVIIEASPDADRWPNPIALTLKKDTCEQGDSLHPGDLVEVEGFLEGRRREGPKGVRHFIDLNAKSIIVTERAALPATAKTWKELLALGAAYGENADAVKERAKALGKPFKEMTEADWMKLAADIVAVHPSADAEPEGGEDEDMDDMPF